MRTVTIVAVVFLVVVSALPVVVPGQSAATPAASAPGEQARTAPAPVSPDAPSAGVASAPSPAPARAGSGGARVPYLAGVLTYGASGALRVVVLTRALSGKA